MLTRICTFAHLDAVFHLHVSQQFAVDTEETKLSLVVVDHAVSLSGGLDETRPQTALRALQGPQQVPIHGMDQTRTLWTNIRQQVKLEKLNLWWLVSVFLLLNMNVYFGRIDNRTFAAADDETQLGAHACTCHFTVMAR